MAVLDTAATIVATAMAPSITHTAFWLLHMAVNSTAKGKLVAYCWVSGDFAFFGRNFVVLLDLHLHERSLAAEGDCHR